MYLLLLLLLYENKDNQIIHTTNLLLLYVDYHDGMSYQLFFFINV